MTVSAERPHRGPACAIQPHGYLLSCTATDWVVQHVSDNIVDLFDLAPEAILGRSLRAHIADDVLAPVVEAIDQLEPGAAPQRVATGNIGAFAHLCDIGVHVADGLVHLEFEPSLGPAMVGEHATPTEIVQRMIARVGGAIDLRGFHQRTASEMRQLTGHDRVLVCRFREDDACVVLAQAHAEDVSPFPDRRLPVLLASRARPLHMRNRVHVIPDVDGAPVTVTPGRAADGSSLDLGRHLLRSATPAHLDTLRTMGVAASMSIAIVRDGRPWGLIACHHRAPRRVSPAVRAAADVFGQFVSMRVASAELEAQLRQVLMGRDAVA